MADLYKFVFLFICGAGILSSLVLGDNTKHCGPTIQNHYNSTKHSCNYTCWSGYWGQECKNPCNGSAHFENCIECFQSDTDNDYFECTVCNSGYYLSNDSKTNCINVCPSNCNESTCHNVSGNCAHGCRPNFIGSKCENCVDGFYGENCNYTCPGICKDGKCNQTTGGCFECTGDFAGHNCTECKPELYGTNCSLNCSEGCQTTDGHRLCHRDDGNCTNGCKKNFTGSVCNNCLTGNHGVSCQETCSIGCLGNNTCDRFSAICVHGCETNYTGDMCCLHGSNTKCDVCGDITTCKRCLPGYHGNDCSLACSRRCEGGRCGRPDGVCLDGCVFGFLGQRCQIDLRIYAGGGSLGLIVVILIIVISAVSYKRKKKGGGVAEQNQEPFSHAAQDVYENSRLADCDLGAEFPVYSQVMKKKTGQNLAIEVHTQQDDFMDTTNEVPYSAGHSVGGSGSDVVGGSGGGVGGTGGFVVGGSGVVGGTGVARITTGTAAVVHDDDGDFDEAGIHAVSVNNSDEGLDDDFEEDEPGTSGINPSGELTEYYNTATRVTVDNLFNYVAKKSSNEFRNEFQSLPSSLVKPWTVAKLPENVGKIRYKGICPYDHSRVTLKEDPKFFINASFIDGFNCANEYIASLGPTTSTMDKFVTFWRMIWSVKTDKIVMLTNLIENTAVKCHQYWPDEGCSQSYGDIRVFCRAQKIFAEYIVRILVLKKEKEERMLSHLHYTVWPDRSVPQDAVGLVEFRQAVLNVPCILKGPTVVHCSAGVGRTGTYIALDRLTTEGQSNGVVNVFSCILDMRDQRVNMVQTAEQYEFLHKCLVYTLCFPGLQVSTINIFKIKQETSIAKIQNMLKEIHISSMLLCPQEEEAKLRNIQEKNKNRKRADIPGDIGRPRLTIGRGLEDSGYINAVFVNGFSTKDEFIIAQTPLPDSVVDFLTLIYQYDVTCVVSMDDVTRPRKDVGMYLPTGTGTARLSCFTIARDNVIIEEGYSERTLHLNMSGSETKGTKKIQHLQFSRWPAAEKAPKDPAQFVQFVRAVERKARRDDVDPRILVHCLNAGDRSGLFCAVSSLLEKMQFERRVNITNTVRQIKQRRNNALNTPEQIQFCLECLALDCERSVYYNL